MLGAATVSCAQLAEPDLAGDDPAAQGIASQEGGSEMAVDAPWRVEPHVGSDGKASYGAIPIQISIHDSDQLSTPGRRILELYSVRVTELRPGGGGQSERDFDIGDLHEIEITRDYWPWPDIGAAPVYQLCRAWAGESCAGFEQVEDSSEWHAVLMYPVVYSNTDTYGHDVRLEVTLSARAQTAERNQTGMTPTWVVRTGDFEHTTQLSVHLGEAPLPRFDDTWAYGDLHYHAQGTDNDGESAYHDRGVVQAMSALGLDFAFATDHASDSEQLIDFYLSILELGFDATARGLRDLDQTRFIHLLNRLHAADGANAQVASYPRPGRNGLAAPSLFQGTEVDIIPEVAAGDHVIGYGQAAYGFYQACRDLPQIAKTRYACPISNPTCTWICDSIMDIVTPTNDGRWLVHDAQGKAELDFFARQHVLHLPTDPANLGAFVSSHTSTYGGATRRFRDVLAEDYAAARKGYTFIAHPFDVPGGAGNGRLGPDILPFDEVQLRDAFTSEFVLGLQLWNGDGRLRSPMGEGDAVDGLRDFVPVYDLANWRHKENTSNQVAWQLSVGTRAWDEMNLWGLDPAQTVDLDWLEPGQPRRVFMSGGSDAHGDLDFHRGGAASNTSSVNDTALGTPRNLVHVGGRLGQVTRDPQSRATGRGVSQQQVMTALQAGEFSVTDGPAVRIAIDLNGNGRIDAGDVPMGGLYDPGHHCPFRLVVEWRSTPEFGGVDHVNLYLGLRSDGGDLVTLWAPAMRGINYLPDVDPAMGSTAKWWLDPETGARYLTVGDDYWVDPTGTLQFRVGSREQFGGRRVVTIDPAAFPVGVGRTEWCEEGPIHSRPAADTEPAEAVAVDDGGDVGNTTSGNVATATQAVAVTSADGSSSSSTSSRTRQEATVSATRATDGDGETATALRQDNPIDDGPFGGGDDIIEPPQEPDCDPSYYFDSAGVADRMFVRAVAINGWATDRSTLCAEGSCIHRVAYTNPIWVLMDGPTSGQACLPSTGPQSALGD